MGRYCAGTEMGCCRLPALADLQHDISHNRFAVAPAVSFGGGMPAL